MIETLAGGLVGGVLRLIPEVLKQLDRRSERAHELALGEQSMRAAQAGAAAAERSAEIGLDAKGLEALIESVRGQSVRTGFWLIDAVSSTVRPVITYWWMALFTAFKYAQISLLVSSGAPWQEAIVTIWGPFESATLGGIINFWFLDRVLRRNG